MTQSAILLETDDDNKQLKVDVFTNMKCDDITSISQRDDLICSLGTRLLKNHREKHLKTYISQRLRQLAKLLKILQSLEPNIKNLRLFSSKIL